MLNMKCYKIFFLFFFLLVFSRADSQVQLSPEIGINYLPHTLYSFNDITSIKSIDYSFGISAKLPTSEKSNLVMRMSYCKRKSKKIESFISISDYVYHKYNHSDISIDFTGNYALHDRIDIGVGGSSIYKLNSYIKVVFRSDEDIVYDQTQFIFGGNIAATFKTRFFNIVLLYTRFFEEENIESLIMYRKEGKNRYILLLSIPILS